MMKSSGPIKLVMFLKSNCPIFKWASDQNLPLFEQISANLGGFFGAFGSLIHLLETTNLVTEGAQLENIRIGKTLIIYRDKDLFQSIYLVESMGLRNKKAITQLMDKIEKEFQQRFGDHLSNWDHSIEPFDEFEEICKRYLNSNPK